MSSQPQAIKTRREAIALLDRVYEADGEFWPLMPSEQEVAQIYAQLVPAERWAVCDTIHAMLQANPELGMQETVEAIGQILAGLQTGTMSHPIALMESIDMLRKLTPDELRHVLSLIHWLYLGGMVSTA